MKCTIILAGSSQRTFAKTCIEQAPPMSVLTIKDPKRSSDQNAKMWALITDIARAKPEGRQWPPETWKAAFMHALGHECLFAMGLDNKGPFPLGFRSSRMTVAQMSDLITYIQDYGDRHGVKWSNPNAD